MAHTMDRPVEAQARLRAKNQLTLPEGIAEALDAHQEDVLLFETDPAEPGTARIRLMPRGFAGAMTGAYGTTEDVKTYLREERAAWGD